MLCTGAISRRYKKHAAPYRGEEVCLSPKKILFSIEGSILVFCKSLNPPPVLPLFLYCCPTATYCLCLKLDYEFSVTAASL